MQLKLLIPITTELAIMQILMMTAIQSSMLMMISHWMLQNLSIPIMMEPATIQTVTMTEMVF
mgnify:CR=1 FL=1